MAALSEIEKLKARFDENPEGRYFAPLADAYRKTGRLDEAIELIQQGLSRHPDYLSAHIVLGRCHLGKKDDPAAKQTFEGVLALDSENIIALKSLAEIGERTGDTIAARRWLDKLLQVDPTNMDAEADLKRLGGPLAEGEDTAAGAKPEAAEEPVPPPSVTEAATAPMPAIDIEPAMAETPLAPAAATSDLGLETTARIPDDVLIVAEEQTDWAHVEHTGMPRERLSSAIAFMGAEGPESIPMDVPLELEPPATAELEPGFEPTSAGAVPVPESSVDLPLIMPEDVTPAAELARPSVKQVATVSPEPVSAAAAASGTPLLTETMAELYLKQGFRAEAADVYRRLLAKQPGDAHLAARLAAVEAPVPSFSASALGQEPLGAWLRRVARSSLSSPAPSEPPPPAGEPTPMDQAFAEPEPVPVEPPGEPARPASDTFTLDRVFGAEAPAETPAAPAAPPPAAPGASFDEFFGASPAPAARPTDAPADQSAPPPEGDDLSSFSTWLHGLKR